MTFGDEPQQNGVENLRWCMAEPRETCSALKVTNTKKAFNVRYFWSLTST